MNDALQRIRSVANYQFGKGVGTKLFPQKVQIAFSKRTGRIRYVYLDCVRLATLRPTDGLFSLSVAGAQRIIQTNARARCFVKVRDDVSKFVMEGGDVFAVHVVEADDEIRPKDEVIVVDGLNRVLAVGRAVLSGEEMKAFKRGVAVRVRHGIPET
jgi:predicted RNA-binding protein (TIGR00451 family)